MDTININWIDKKQNYHSFRQELVKFYPTISFKVTKRPVSYQQTDLYILDADFFTEESSYFVDQQAPPSIIFGEEKKVFQTALLADSSDAVSLPLEPNELAFRIFKNALSSSIDFGIGTVSFSKYELKGPEGKLNIQYNKYLLLRLFSHNSGTVYSRETIARFTGMKESEDSRVVDVHVSKLRSDLIAVLGCKADFNPIVGIRRKGYRTEKKIVDNLCKTEN